MGVFDPRQGQVLVSPVTNYYKGKAIRQEQAAQEQMAEMRSLQIDEAKYQQSPERRAKQEEIIDQKLEAARMAVDQAEVNLGADTLKFMANTLAPVTSGATEFALSGDIEGGVEYFNKEIKRLLPTLPSSIQEAVKKGAGEDHVYDIEEIANTKLMLAAWGQKSDATKHKPVKFMLNGKRVQGTVDEFGNYFDGNRNLAIGDIQPIDKDPLVQINQGKPDKGTEEYQKSIGERAAKRDEQSNATLAEDARLNQILLSLSRGAQTGTAESLILDARNLLETTFGVEMPDSANEGEVVRALGNQLAMMARNPDSGLGLTGSTSNKDLDFLKDSVAGIQKSEKANVLLVNAALNLNQMKRDLAKEQARIIRANEGRLPSNLDEQLMEYANNYELFSKEERKEIKDAIESPPESKSVVDRVKQETAPPKKGDIRDYEGSKYKFLGGNPGDKTNWEKQSD